MAINAASHNPSAFPQPPPDTVILKLTFQTAAEPTGPTISGPPPDVSDETTEFMQQATKKDSLGHQEAGKDEHGNEESQTEFGSGGKPMTARESVTRREEPH